MKNTSEESGTKESRNASEDYRIWLKERKIEFDKIIEPYVENLKSNSSTDNQ